MPPHYSSPADCNTYTASKCFCTPTYQKSPDVPWGRTDKNTERGGENGCTLPDDWPFTRCHPRVHGRCAVDLQLRGWLPAADEYGSEA